jgi:hypothetical protein
MATQRSQYTDGNGHRNPRELEHDIQQTRTEMDETIHKLSERLSPRRLMDEAYDYLRSSTGLTRDEMAHHAKSIGKSAARSIKRHPIPSLLIGAGLLYMLFEQDEDEERDFHSQWDGIPEYSGSFVDARTGEPYDLETYGAEWRQEVPAWRQGYDWSRSDVSEESWGHRARETLASIKSTLSDSTKSAGHKLRHAASGVIGLSGHKRRELHSRWANLKEHSGSFVDARTGEPYDESYGRDWEALMGCDYCANCEWSPEDEATWSEKTQGAVQAISETLSDTGRSAKEQVQSIAAKIGDVFADSGKASAGFARSIYGRAGQAGEGIRHGAASAGRGMARSARYVGRKTRRGSQAAERQLQHGYEYSRDAISSAMDEYPLAAGAAFLGLGLLVGFALPESRYEDRMMGEASDELKERAKETGREAVHRAREVATATAEAALDEAERQGLAPHQLGEKVEQAASDVKRTVQEKMSGEQVRKAGEKVSHIAHRAAETAKEETRAQAEDMTS